MTMQTHLTSSDLELLPLDDGTRYEIIDGVLHVTRQPDANHQLVCGRIFSAFDEWNAQTGAGTAYPAPGVIFAEDQDVAPDVAWVSAVRRARTLGGDGHFHGAPELVVEVLSPGATSERRDREIKLALYSRQGVDEYWIVDWPARTIDVYRRQEDVLEMTETLQLDGAITSPLLPGFSAPLRRIFAGISKDPND